MMRLMPNEMLPVSFRDDFRIKEFILDQSKGVEVATSQIDYGLTGKYSIGHALEIYSEHFLLKILVNMKVNTSHYYKFACKWYI